MRNFLASSPSLPVSQTKKGRGTASAKARQAALKEGSNRGVVFYFFK
jgi:hypothetical protein